VCASHSPTHDAASPRLLRHRKTQIRPYLQCVCGLARTANPGRSRMEIRPDAIAPLHNTGEGEVQSLKSKVRGAEAKVQPLRPTAVRHLAFLLCVWQTLALLVAGCAGVPNHLQKSRAGVSPAAEPPCRQTASLRATASQAGETPALL
jgi:hypothetical protein